MSGVSEAIYSNRVLKPLTRTGTIQANIIAKDLRTTKLSQEAFTLSGLEQAMWRREIVLFESKQIYNPSIVILESFHGHQPPTLIFTVAPVDRIYERPWSYELSGRQTMANQTHRT